MSYQLIRADAGALPLADKSVNLTVTSSPYYGQRDYQDDGKPVVNQLGAEEHPSQFVKRCVAIMAELWRVTADDGSVFWNMGDKRAGSGAPGTTTGFGGGVSGLEGTAQQRAWPADARVQGRRSEINGQYPQQWFGKKKGKQLIPHRFAIACMDAGWIVRNEIIWHKANGLPESVKDRTRDDYEMWFHFVKQGNYYANMDPIREPHADATFERAERNRYRQDPTPRQGQGPQTLDLAQSMDPNGRLPGSVWKIATEPLNVPSDLEAEHFAAFPSEWPRRLILAWSREGDVVLDPFGGTGTTAAVAHALGRHGISSDLSGAYQRIARWRIEESGLVDRIHQRTYGRRLIPSPAKVDGQLSLI